MRTADAETRTIWEEAVIGCECAGVRCGHWTDLRRIVERIQAEARAAGVRQERRIVVAWLRDRMGQYRPSSGSVTAIEERMVEIDRGDHAEAAKHGELDDLLAAPPPEPKPGEEGT